MILRTPVVWVTTVLPRPDGNERELLEHELLSAVARRHEVHLVSAALPPGTAPLDVGGAVIDAEGVDWAVRPLPAEGVPGLRRVVHAVCVLAGRDPRSVRLAHRHRALAVAGLRAATRHSAALIQAVGVDVARELGAATIPVLALAVPGSTGPMDAGDVEPPGRGAFIRRFLDRGARRGYAAAVAVATTRVEDRDSLAGTLGRPVELVRGGDDLDAWWRGSVKDAASPPAPAAAPVDRSRPSGAVVMATADRPDLLERSLPPLTRAAARVPGTEVIVVEQGCTAAAALVDRLGLDVTVHHDEGRGASRARNLGAAATAAEVVLFTDDDCVVPETWVVDHLDALADPMVSASFGVVHGLTRAAASHGDPVERDRVHHPGALPWHVGHGSNMAIRRTELGAVGGWDERIGPGTTRPAGEDADLIVRLLEAGHAVRSGVGRPVEHMDWRSSDADDRNLRSYELGAGYWIGKALRSNGSGALHYVGARLRLIDVVHGGGPAFERLRARLRFGRGLLQGWRLGRKHR